ncbi:BON domain-containing protein [Nitrospirillum sp. BR 11164]|uniref:BON domain-containing protein n=1 Tax=Nitrospirillum sp. BR 11164 TaxID=3104324 RepID=UPI002AFED56E|nr:BON domain-containing protein [Nitrospirillum sp. BR 11164]MEA1648020.1 BON domain-containing protein [Nitrospirillum sp. BR 11164]
MSDDKTLQLDVMAELAWDPHLDASHIGVTAEGVVVTLTGHVRTWAEKRAAVANEIEVRLPPQRQPGGGPSQHHRGRPGGGPEGPRPRLAGT